MGIEAQAVFQLDETAPEQAMQEAVCAKLQQLRSMAAVMESQDFYLHPPTVLQGYSWTLVDMIDEVQELFFTLWERKQAMTCVQQNRCASEAS